MVERTANSMEKGGRREESRGQQSQRETGEHDVVSRERKGYFENVIRGKAGARSCGQTSQLRSTPCAICQPDAICSNLCCHMIRLVHAGCAARSCALCGRGKERRKFQRANRRKCSEECFSLCLRQEVGGLKKKKHN